MKAELAGRRDGGFTLIELLIVVAVIGIIAAIAIPNLINAINRSRQSRTLADMRVIAQGIETYQNDNSYYPLVNDGTVADLALFIEGYLRNYNRLDGWSEPVHYSSNGTTYTMISFGWNGVSNLPYVPGPTNSFDADIVLVDGGFYQWPEGQQTR